MIILVAILGAVHLNTNPLQDLIYFTGHFKAARIYGITFKVAFIVLFCSQHMYRIPLLDHTKKATYTFS